MIDLFKIPPAIAAANVDTDQLRWVTGMVRSPEQFVEKVIYLYAHPAEISRDEVELKDGTVLDRYSAPVVGKDGQSYGRIWTFRDITERRRDELAVRESEARFAAAFEHAPIGVALVSPAGRWLKVNRALSEVVGYSEAELLTRTFQDTTHPDDLAADLEQGRQLLAGEIRSYQMEKRYVHQRGHVVTVLLNVSLVRDAQDQPRYYISQVQDITARKAAEFRLLEALAEGQRLRAALDQVSAYIYMKDLEGRYTYANRRTLEFFGCSATDLDGRSDRHFFPPEAVQRLQEVDRRVFQGQETNEELEIVDARGERRVYLEVKSPLHAGTGDRTIVGLLGVSTDITERQREEAMVRDSKRFLQSTLDALSSHIAILDEDGRIVEVNAAWQSFARANQFIGGHWGVGVNYVQLCESASGACSVEAAAVAAGIRSVMAGRQDEFHLEYPCHSPQEQRWFIARVTRFGGAGPVRVVVAHENITERKQAENAVRASDEKFRQLADHITDAFWIRSPDLREVHYISPAFEQIWGRPVASLYANPQQWADFILPEDRERVEATFAALTGAAPSLDLEYRIVRPNGEIRWVRVRGFQVRDAANNLIRHAGIVTDITERKQADEVLQRTEAVYRAAIVGAGAVPYSSDYQSKSYLFMGEGIEQLIGYAPSEVTGQLWKQIIQESIMAGETAGLSKDEAARRMASGEIRSWRCDMRVRTRDGKLRWISDAAVQQLDASGLPVGSMGILQDITERKQNEIFALAFSELGSRLSSVNTVREAFGIVHEISRGLFGWDAFGIRLYRAEYDSIYAGYTVDTIDGRPVVEDQREPLKPGELYRRVMERGGELVRRDPKPEFTPGITPFGNVSRPSATLMFVPIRSSGHPVGVLSVQSYTPNAYDERDLETLQTMADQCGGAFERIWADELLRKIEAQLFQAQKLETVGKLAGGIAHEFNSIMTVIIGQSELLLGDLPVGDGLRENATEIRKAADRAATLTRQLLAYGRKQMLLPEVLDLNVVVTGLTGMIRHLLGRTVDVRLVADPGIKSVKVDAGQMELVIINIVMNAADAMPHGGKLTLETAPITLDQNYVSQFPDLKAGEYVLLAITDTGTGMSEEVQARVFDPFFTTKAVGKGSGLGLSTCHGIIKQSGGHIAVYSEPGWGTTFKIYLPEVSSAIPVLQPLESPRTTSGTETILLVEDDPALREMAAKLLGRLGYRVFMAGDGQAALTLAQQPGTARVDLLFTDVVMPHIDGKELAGQVRALFPRVKVLFTSAYTEGAIVHQGVLDPGVELLLKPFTPAALAEKVRALLDKPLPPRPDAAPGASGFSENQMG